MIGRFLSPDLIISDYYDPQNLNRYSYCLNNPLIYTDPTGHYILGPSDEDQGYLEEDENHQSGEAYGPYKAVTGRR